SRRFGEELRTEGQILQRAQTASRSASHAEVSEALRYTHIEVLVVAHQPVFACMAGNRLLFAGLRELGPLLFSIGFGLLHLPSCLLQVLGCLLQVHSYVHFPGRDEGGYFLTFEIVQDDRLALGTVAELRLDAGSTALKKVSHLALSLILGLDLYRDCSF